MGMKTKKRIEINKFNNFNVESSEVVTDNFYNYHPTNALKNSLGVGVATFPLMRGATAESELNIDSAGITQVKGVEYFKQYFPTSGNTQHRVLLYGDDKKVYIHQLFDGDADLYWLYGLQFESAPLTLTYKKDNNDAIILASTDKMVVWQTNLSPYTIQNVPIITSMCMNEGVLFCTIKEPAFKVWYATNLNPEAIGNISNNSGYISLEDDLGYARKIITFNEDVFVFREYGISKINFTKNHATVSQVYASNTKIFTNTVSVCGNVVMFATVEGIYSFNGVKVSKTDINISTILPVKNDNATASSLGENYYLALRLNFGDSKQILCEQEDYKNNAILVVNTQDFSYQIIRGVDVASWLPIKLDEFEKMLITFNTGHTEALGQIVETSTYFGSALPKFWATKVITNNFSTKLFTKLQVVADCGVKFNLKHDNGATSFTTYVNGLNEFNFQICCKQIWLDISSNETTAQVERVELGYYEY